MGSLEIGWPMAGFGALATGCIILAWVCFFETRALRACGVSWADILGLPERPEWTRVLGRRRSRSRLATSRQ
jgi:hypothetical protein